MQKRSKPLNKFKKIERRQRVVIKDWWKRTGAKEQGLQCERTSHHRVKSQK